MVSPGASSTPANNDPAITTFAPAASALEISPLQRIHPSAITGIHFFFNAWLAFIIADNCGIPIPATILVVQILPGPIPTLTASTPASANAIAASPVAMFPQITCV